MNKSKILILLVGLMTLFFASTQVLAVQTESLLFEEFPEEPLSWFLENQVTEFSSFEFQEQHLSVMCFIFGCSGPVAPTNPPARNWFRQQIGETNCTLRRACEISCCDLNIYNSTSEFNSCVSNCVENTTGPGGPTGCTPI